MLLCENMGYCISIHAPTRGATIRTSPKGKVYCKFQSTLPREERPLARVNKAGTREFQSTLPREERLLKNFKIHLQRGISIHAPTRGATPRTFICALDNSFQSTLPREERHAPDLAYLFVPEFQSTLPREERHSQGPLSAPLITHFNPRSHERSDDNLR